VSSSTDAREEEYFQCPSCGWLMEVGPECEGCGAVLIDNSSVIPEEVNADWGSRALLCMFCKVDGKVQTVRATEETLREALKHDSRNDLEKVGKHFVRPYPIAYISEAGSGEATGWAAGLGAAGVAFAFFSALGFPGIVVGAALIFLAFFIKVNSDRDRENAKSSNRLRTQAKREILAEIDRLASRSICTSCGRLQDENGLSLKAHWTARVAHLPGTAEEGSHGLGPGRGAPDFVDFSGYVDSRWYERFLN